ncbi:MAG: glycerophosphodiester phosphodiesterase [Gemmatimonadota bacterium]
MIGHRGVAAEAPENTIASLDLAMRLGADALELDVRRTRDGELVLIHDPTLDRTTDRSGAVAGLPASEVRAARAGPGPGECVPTLRDALSRFPGVDITVDVKDPEAAEDVVRLLGELDRVESTILYVEDGTEQRAFREYTGRRATSTRQAVRLALQRGLSRARSGRRVEVVHTPLRRWGLPIVTEAFVARMREQGRSVQVWTVDEPAEMARLASWGVDGIITNDVRTAVRVLGGGGPEATPPRGER